MFPPYRSDLVLAIAYHGDRNQWMVKFEAWDGEQLIHEELFETPSATDGFLMAQVKWIRWSRLYMGEVPTVPEIDKGNGLRQLSMFPRKSTKI